ncbi:hypothetical protein PISMIDRAFT_145799 [Pisolithus microcarpus 441]|uniref:Uncharacterized protein n=1 Tax=Pisolithus microcarpus 441 TaxID=765257 RepID=A0A0C9ZF01_9AGAM|nr:hypothetical protein PISMIDRAFT_145799 [Pisolithus microcarpus 441]
MSCVRLCRKIDGQMLQADQTCQKCRFPRSPGIHRQIRLPEHRQIEQVACYRHFDIYQCNVAPNFIFVQRGLVADAVKRRCAATVKTSHLRWHALLRISQWEAVDSIRYMEWVSATNILYFCKVGTDKGDITLFFNLFILAVLERPCSPPTCSSSTEDRRCEHLRIGGCLLRLVRSRAFLRPPSAPSPRASCTILVPDTGDTSIRGKMRCAYPVEPCLRCSSSNQRNTSRLGKPLTS